MKHNTIVRSLRLHDAQTETHWQTASKWKTAPLHKKPEEYLATRALPDNATAGMGSRDLHAMRYVTERSQVSHVAAWGVRQATLHSIAGIAGR